MDKKDGVPYILKEDELVENNLSESSSMVYYYLNNSKSEDLILDVLPHEMMHAFGFSSGVYEGLTENLTREVCAKYGIKNMPTARKDLVKLTQNIEKIIGRDKLVENAHDIEGKGERTDIISSLIDEKLQSEDKDLFKKYYDSIKASSSYETNLEKRLLEELKNGKITMEEAKRTFEEDTNIKKYKEDEKEFYIKLNFNLEEYVEKNPEKLYELGAQTSNIKDVLKKEKNLKEVLVYQESEMDSLNLILNEIKEKNAFVQDDFKDSLKSMVNSDEERAVATNNKQDSLEFKGRNKEDKQNDKKQI